MISLKVCNCKCSTKVIIFGAAMKLFKLVELVHLLQVPRNLSKTSGVIGDRCGLWRKKSLKAHETIEVKF